jgi:hypothetical protein
MTSWNNFKTYQGNYANSDEEYLRDANRPRDQYWFKLNNKGWDWHSWIGWAEDKEKIQNNTSKLKDILISHEVTLHIKIYHSNLETDKMLLIFD